MITSPLVKVQSLPVLESIIELLDNFHSEEQCINLLESILWKNGVISPFDPNSKVYKCRDHRYKCKNSNKYFNVKHGTIFYNSPIKLRKWFTAIWLITSEKKGISSLQLRRHLKVSKQTAWFMLHRIRHCFSIENNHQLTDQVEIDETYIGGKNKNRHPGKKIKGSQGRSSKDKTPILGMVQRGGKLVARPVKDVKSSTITPEILKNVQPGNVCPELFDNIPISTLYTDEWRGYGGIDKIFDHYAVKHNEGEYVNGVIHTNTIEGFWSLLKRGIVGVYHHTSRKHLRYYVDEFVFRYNTITMEDGERFNSAIANCDNYLSYDEFRSAA